MILTKSYIKDINENADTFLISFQAVNQGFSGQEVFIFKCKDKLLTKQKFFHYL